MRLWGATVRSATGVGAAAEASVVHEVLNISSAWF